MDFIVNNIGSVAVGLAVAALVVLLSYKLISDKKKGRSSCGCGCSGCPNAGLCHGSCGRDEQAE